jgi:hypothetical protein
MKAILDTNVTEINHRRIIESRLQTQEMQCQHKQKYSNTFFQRYFIIDISSHSKNTTI